MHLRAETRRSRFPVAALLVLTLSCMVLASSALPLLLDEAYYWTWSKALSLSYVDHPPGIAFYISFWSLLFGDGILALRVGAFVAAVGVAALSFLTACRLSGDLRSGLWSLLLLASSLMFVIGYLPATPDVLQGFFLALLGYFLVSAFQEKTGWRFFCLGFFAVSLLVFKVSSFFILAGAFLVVVTDTRARRELKHPAFLGGVLIGLAAIAPWAFSEVLHQGGSFVFQRQRFSAPSLVSLVQAPFLVFGALLIVAGIFAAWGTLFLSIRLLVSQDVLLRIFAGGSGAFLLACAVASVFGSGEVNWVMPVFVFFLPVLAKWSASLSGRYALFAKCSTALSYGVCLLLLLHVAWPYLPIPPLRDRTLRSAGYRELTKKAEHYRRLHGATIFFTERYQMSSQVRFHLGDLVPVYEIGGSGKESQYDRWSKPKVGVGTRGILIRRHGALPEWMTAVGEVQKVVRQGKRRSFETWFLTPVEVQKLAGRHTNLRQGLLTGVRTDLLVPKLQVCKRCWD